MKEQKPYRIEDHLLSNYEKFESIETEKDWQKVRERMGFGGEQQQRIDAPGKRMRMYWSAAAVAIILLGVGFMARNILTAPPAMLVAQTGETKKEVVLPDGSLISLNRFSELTYPEKFGRKSRSVSFTGEGFFEIASDPKKPFTISINEMATVEVLGTSFNINAASESDSVMVHVVEGRVAFFTAGSPDERLLMNKNDQAVLKSGNIRLEKTANRNFLSWKTGVLYFDQKTLASVIAELSKHYHREIVLEDPEGEEILFTSIIDNQELESVLDEIQLVLGLEYKFDGEKVLIYRPD